VITHAVDVTGFVDQKRAAMQAHASQIGPDSFFMKMPDAIYAMAFGTEWFVDLAHPRAAGAPFATDLLADLTNEAA
jgi:LmbE family N-acetylglucosaminyl deacetylase